MTSATLFEYLAEKLAADGYGGLCCEDCGCDLSELCPCDTPTIDCIPGYRHDCEECPRQAEDNCPMEDAGYDGCTSIEKTWPEAKNE